MACGATGRGFKSHRARQLLLTDENLVKLASSIADKILVEHGKLVTLKFINEGDLKRGKARS